LPSAASFAKALPVPEDEGHHSLKQAGWLADVRLYDGDQGRFLMVRETTEMGGGGGVGG
jgi:hypothetical protein